MKPTFFYEYDTYIFDCDGVLMDTNLLKCDAFGMAVEGYPTEIIESFVNYCKNTFGISRYIKFKEFLINFAKEPFQEEKYQILLTNYANICKEIYFSADITPGTLHLLQKLTYLNKNLYVSSGSDEKELREIFIAKNLSGKFKGIYGSPKTKLECTSLILKDHQNDRIVFIGDALSDMTTAREHNIDFIYMSNYTVQTVEQDLDCREGAITVINTLLDL
jgi:phosphoglycolate phosphatase-like HAD superfamily hydrolase